MSLPRDRAFGADSPVGRYWLANCIGFRVEGSWLGPGVVEDVGRADDGGDVLAVRRSRLLARRIYALPAERVAAVHPWQETIVLAPRASRAATRARTASAAARRHVVALERRLRPVMRSGGAATARGLHAGAFACRKGGLAFARATVTAALVLVALARRYAPVARRTAASGSRIAVELAAAYAREAARIARETRAALAEGSPRRLRRAIPQASEEPVAPLEESYLEWPTHAESELDIEATANERSRRAG